MYPRSDDAESSTESLSQDAVCSMAKSTWKAALLLQTMAGYDHRDSSSETQEPIPSILTGTFAALLIPRDLTLDYLSPAVPRKDGLDSFHFGIPIDHFLNASSKDFPILGCPNEIRKSTESFITSLRHTSRADMNLTLNEIWDYIGAMVTKINNEFRSDLEGYLAELENVEIKSLQDLIDYNERHSVSRQRFRGCESEGSANFSNSKCHQEGVAKRA